MSRRPVRYRAQEILDYNLDGNFAFPSDNGFESDIEGFESDNDDDLTRKCHIRSQIDLRNFVIIED